MDCKKILNLNKTARRANRCPIVNKYDPPEYHHQESLPPNMGTSSPQGSHLPIVNLPATNLIKMPNKQEKVPRAIASRAPHENPHQQYVISIYTVWMKLLTIRKYQCTYKNWWCKDKGWGVRWVDPPPQKCYICNRMFYTIMTARMVLIGTIHRTVIYQNKPKHLSLIKLIFTFDTEKDLFSHFLLHDFYLWHLIHINFEKRTCKNFTIL